MSRRDRHRAPRQIVFFFVTVALCLLLDQGVKVIAHARLANASAHGPDHYITLTVPAELDGHSVEEVLTHSFPWSSSQEVHDMAEHYTRRLGGFDLGAKDRLSVNETLRIEHRSIHLVRDRLALELHHNRGASFDLGTGSLGLTSRDLGLFGLLIFVGAFLSLALFDRWRRLSSAGLGALAGGTLANAYDRLFRGHVIDYVVTPYLPPFNLADVLIGLGGLCIALSSARTLVHLLRLQREQRRRRGST